MSVKEWFAAVAVSMCLISPPVSAQIFSWGPLKDVQEALAEGVPNEGKIIHDKPDLRLQQRTGAAELHQSRVGVRRQVNLSAMAGGQGGMFSSVAAVSPGVYLYQLTQTGLSTTLTFGGTRFFTEGDLN
jgi:hypothetical protein